MTDVRQGITQLKTEGLVSKTALLGSGTLSTHVHFATTALTFMALVLSSGFRGGFVGLFVFKSQNKNLHIYLSFRMGFLSV